MNEQERELAALLKSTTGEPPDTPDADTLVAAARPSRRQLAPLLAVAAVLVIAIPLAVLLNRDSSPSKPIAGRRGSPTGWVSPPSPRAVAISAAEAILAIAPTPPGATRRRRAPSVLRHGLSETPGAQHVQRTRIWTGPGNVAAVVSYLRSHPPNGMSLAGWGSATGPGMSTSQTLSFQSGAFRSLQYTVVSYRHGVALRAEAQVLWAPLRSPADTVPASVTSVDVLVVRKNPRPHQGAPTVRRTLAGGSARALARFVNRLPRAVPTGPQHCPAAIGQLYDRLVFHSAGPTARVLVNLAGCATTTFQVGHRTAIQLDQTYGAHRDLDHAILAALGLPPGYGG